MPTWKIIPLEGRIVAWTVVHRSPRRDLSAPYGLVLVELGPTLRLLARASRDLERLVVGAAVALGPDGGQAQPHLRVTSMST